MNAKIITVGAIKGGVGKTLTACQLAARLSQEKGKKIVMISGDNQGTCSIFLQFRMKNKNVPSFDLVSAKDEEVRKKAISFKQKYDVIVIDVGGTDNQSQRAAMSISDVFLVPFAPKSFEIWTADDVVALVEDLKKINNKMKCLCFINTAETIKNSKDNAAAKDKLKEEMKWFSVLDAKLSDRKAFSNASSIGLCVNETNYSMRDKKAILELETLYQEILKNL